MPRRMSHCRIRHTGHGVPDSGKYTAPLMQPDTVFKAYDIRGRTDNGELDAELYRRVGAAVVTLLETDRLAIGRDCRPSSEPFAAAMAEGAMSHGADVIDLGEVPTDAVYFFSGANRVAGAIITASHNPPEYNGIKLCRPGALPIGTGTGLEEIKKLVTDGIPEMLGRQGIIESVDMVDAYVDHLFSIVTPDSIGPLRVAVDGGNGMAGVAIHRVFDRIPASLDGLYLDPDGSFPNHPADPLNPENLVDLQRFMKTGDYDLGVAFDGDADRAFFLDDRAEPLGGSAVTSLIARQILTNNPGATVVHNLITSKAVPEIVREAGGVPLRTRVGHSFIKKVMAETGAVFGGEHSAHYYFRDNFGADSGMLAMLHLLAILSAGDEPLSAVRKEVERYSASGEINFKVGDTTAAMNKVGSRLEGASVDHLDGLTADFGHEWFNLRPSNTEPLLRLNVEAADEARVAALVRYVRDILEN